MSIELCITRAAQSFHMMDQKDAQTKELIRWIDAQIANPVTQDGMTLEEKVHKLKEAKKDAEKLFEVVEQGRQELKQKLESMGHSVVAEVAFTMKDFIPYF